jgi:hypothetical protein
LLGSLPCLMWAGSAGNKFVLSMVDEGGAIRQPELLLEKKGIITKLSLYLGGSSTDDCLG